MLASRFLRLSVIYALIGIALGIVIAATRDLSQMPTHAHINLLGFVAMAIYGFFYRLYPAAEAGWMAPAHFWIANLGFVALMACVAAAHGGYELAEEGAKVFSLVVIAGMALFAVIVFRATARPA
ncbi:MAG: cytochrome-c oxidase [Alphaproteobacteria bacterium]|nr:cytochrome-c oxidase [Alphaproteobacteria bacterium]